MTPEEMVTALVSKDLFTEKELAELCDCTQPTIHRIKHGSVKNPRWQVVENIKRIYDEKFPVVHRTVGGMSSAAHS